jgi:hypothetical protein
MRPPRCRLRTLMILVGATAAFLALFPGSLILERLRWREHQFAEAERYEAFAARWWEKAAEWERAVGRGEDPYTSLPHAMEPRGCFLQAREFERLARRARYWATQPPPGVTSGSQAISIEDAILGITTPPDMPGESGDYAEWPPEFESRRVPIEKLLSR